jgi:hypothetical protein
LSILITLGGTLLLLASQITPKMSLQSELILIHNWNLIVVIS